MTETTVELTLAERVEALTEGWGTSVLSLPWLRSVPFTRIQTDEEGNETLTVGLATVSQAAKAGEPIRLILTLFGGEQVDITGDYVIPGFRFGGSEITPAQEALLAEGLARTSRSGQVPIHRCPEHSWLKVMANGSLRCQERAEAAARKDKSPKPKPARSGAWSSL